MKRLRVAYPAYCTDKYNWDRMAAVLKPLSAVCDLEVFHFGDAPPAVDWCKLTQVSAPSNMLNLRSIAEGALRIVMELGDFDVLYCWSGGVYQQALNVLVAEAARKPCVMHINGDAALSRKHHLQPVNQLSQDALDRFCLNAVDLLVPISSVLKRAVEGRVKHIRVSDPVPFCVDSDHFKPLPFPEELCVGYGGRVSPEKGFPFFTQVMDACAGRKFRLAGVLQMAMSFPENAHYMGCLSLRDMTGFYGLSSVVALPSYGEGIPGIVLEAYACGRPVIVSPEALPPEMPCFGWTVGRDVAEWRRVIEGLSQEEIEEKGAEARAWVTQCWPLWRDFAVIMKKELERVVHV